MKTNPCQNQFIKFPIVLLFLLCIIFSVSVFADEMKLSKEQRAILQQALNGRKIDKVSELPQSVIKICADHNGRLAGPGQRWEAGCVIRDVNIPRARLIWAMNFEEYYIVHYERGGYAHSFYVVLAQVQADNKPALVLWRGGGPRYKDYKAFLAGLEQNKVD